jgi:voltage-gated potassium channel
MTVITITTVGYGEVLPNMEHVEYARGFTILQLVFGTGVLVYFASTITAFIVEGDLKRVLATQRLRKRIKKMKDHVIVCGAGSTGRHIIEELIKTLTPVVAVDTNEDELKDIAARHPGAEYTYVVGDATDDDVIAQVNLSTARGLVAALSSDKDNLYIVVSARLTGSNLRIIARCAELSHVEKLKRAGADGVVSPNHIGGMRMVSEMVRPSVVRFLDEMLRDKRGAFRIEEIAVTAGSPLDGKTLREADVRGKFGMGVLALRTAPEEPWTYNPGADLKLARGAVLVVMGEAKQIKDLRDHAAPG